MTSYTPDNAPIATGELSADTVYVCPTSINLIYFQEVGSDWIGLHIDDPRLGSVARHPRTRRRCIPQPASRWAATQPAPAALRVGCHQRWPRMTARPCAQCGDIIATGTYCTECKPKPAATTKVRPKGHVHTNTTRWKRLSDKARKLQPWCVDCGAHDDLTGDHIIPVSEDPTLAYEVLNIAVRCRTCNSRRGNRCTDEERQAVLSTCKRARRAWPSSTPPTPKPSLLHGLRGAGWPLPRRSPALRARRGRRYTPLGGVCEGQPSRNPDSEYLGTGAFRISRLMIAVCDHFVPNIHDEVIGLSLLEVGSLRTPLSRTS